MRFGGQAVVYGSSRANLELHFRPLIARFIRLYFFVVYVLPPEERAAALERIEALLHEGRIQHPPTTVMPLEQIALAHDAVDRGNTCKVLVSLSRPSS